MQDLNNDDVKEMLEMLRRQADVSSQTDKEAANAQTTDDIAHSDDEIKDMLKRQISSESIAQDRDAENDYSFDTVDFVPDDDMESYDIPKSEPVEAAGADDNDSIEDGAEDENAEHDAALDNEVREAVEDVIADSDAELDAIVDEISSDNSNEASISEDILDESALEGSDSEPEEQDIVIEQAEENVDFEVTHSDTEEESEPILEAEFQVEDEQTVESAPEITVEPEIESEPMLEYEARPDIEVEAEPEVQPVIESEAEHAPEIESEEPISEESINYDEVLEGQQGTVFNKFVEDFTGELDDVVFEAEITDSHAPNKQYTIFEDWEKLMEKKDYATAEEGIIPPTPDELAYSAEISKAASGKTDYFKPPQTEDLDAVDIALMVALGGEGELNKTVGFEKIRQAVHDAKEDGDKGNVDKSVYGCCGSEYSSASQVDEIKKKYKKDKLRTVLQLIGTAVLGFLLLCHEMCGWTGASGAVSFEENPSMFVFGGLQLLIFCFIISLDKLIKFVKRPLSSSVSYLAAVASLVLCIVHDVLLAVLKYSDMGVTLHSISAFLILLGLIYDLFDISQQSSAFDIVSKSEKKLVLEPYGKVRMSDNEDRSDVIDKDSYCISRVPTVEGFFARTSASSPYSMTRIITLVLCLSSALCVMLLLLLMGRELSDIILGFIITLCFSLVCASICDGEFAFHTAYKCLKKYKTGLIGKRSTAEYGKCNIIYFDDYNVFNKRSVRTKGLKLYDNNEIYRVLYHTQAVFSKVGGPLKGVFEFATTEMIHSKNVEIKEISKEGIAAVVDGKTTVLIGTGSFMKGRGIHPSYTAADIKSEQSGEESIMFIAIGGKLGAKLYVTYHFSSEFERLAKKLSACGIGIGIRSCDPNVNEKWAKDYGALKGFDISVVRPTLKEIKPHEKSIDSGIVSAKNVRALCEALMMCVKLDSLESIMTWIRSASVITVAILSFALIIFSGVNAFSILVLSLACALCASVTMLLSHFYIKH